MGYILSAQYFAKDSICRVEKHSKCKILKTIHYLTNHFGDVLLQSLNVNRSNVRNWIDN